MPRSTPARLAAALRCLLPACLPLACLVLAQPAFANTPACSATAGPLQCHLDQILHLLDAAAFLLVLILAAALAFAIIIYRRNRKAQPPAPPSKPRNPPQ
jgi:hypothetical protein